MPNYSPEDIQRALVATINELGVPSTVGTGKCLCYGSTMKEKCQRANMKGLWDADAYASMSRNGVEVRNAKDLINLNIGAALQSIQPAVRQVSIRGKNFVICTNR